MRSSKGFKARGHAVFRIECTLLLLCLSDIFAADQRPPAELIAKENRVEYRRGTSTYLPAQVGLHLQLEDRLVTRSASRATVLLTTLQKIRLDQETELTIVGQPAKPRAPLLDLVAGAFYYFSRDPKEDFEIRTRHVSGGARGTEFLVQLDQDQTVVTVFDGEVDLENAAGPVTVRSGFQAVAPELGPIQVRPILEAKNLVQWWLFYPGVIDPDELQWEGEIPGPIQESVRLYRDGDLLGALANFPAGREPQSATEKIFRAALLLAVGRADEALAQTEGVELAPARAIRTLVEAVRGRAPAPLKAAESASEWLASSYAFQAQHDLEEALRATEQALQRSPQFAFAMVRKAELEFSFGRTASAVLSRALELAPRNAQALALRGFMRSADGAYADAEVDFENALELDPALGNAWLGRGLLKIRAGQTEAGVSDLQTAATLERNRAFLRSYLAKGLGLLGDIPRAELELALARKFDPNDPTSWLYSALLERDRNRINQAVNDLERSLELNEQRRVYRSRQMLDRDRAVRSSNLASIYENAGMDDLSVREASRAVSADYANFSAHLFLAESYHALRDPTRFNLRYETVWFNELLLANLLAPVGVGALSQNVSQQEYSKLFERNPDFGLDSVSQYRSDGQYQQLATHYGVYGPFGYSLDLDYQHNSGVRPNNDLDRIEWYSQFKWELSPRDSLFLLTKYQNFESGDNFQYRDPENSSRTFRFTEQQEPLIWGSYQRTWQNAPASHSFVSVGRLSSDMSFFEGDQLPTKFIGRDFFSGEPRYLGSLPGEGEGRVDSRFEVYIAELQHLYESERHRIIAGWRIQGGEFEFKHNFTTASYLLNDPAMDRWQAENFMRNAGYAYYTYKAAQNLDLTGGFTYDVIEYPEHTRHPPFQTGQARRSELLPKASAVYSPGERLNLHAMYSRAMGGVSFDESFRLEPAQLAGFPQAFRTIVSESLVSSIEAPLYDLIGAGVDFKLPARSYLGLRWTYAEAEFHRQVGFYDQPDPFDASTLIPSATREDLKYDEHIFSVTFNQLLGEQWSWGVAAQIQLSEIENSYAEPILDLEPSLKLDGESRLHRILSFLLWNHPSGLFARAEADHYIQANEMFPDERLTQFNLIGGLRFRQNKAEVSVGVLNLGDQDYRLYPLNTYAELPRERVFVGRLRFSF